MKINTIIESQKEISFTPEDVSCVYVGKPNCCMCGCSGDYFYTSKNAAKAGQDRGYEVTEDEINDAKVNTVLELFEQSGRIENIYDYIFTKIIGGKRYTIYLIK